MKQVDEGKTATSWATASVSSRQLKAAGAVALLVCVVALGPVIAGDRPLPVIPGFLPIVSSLGTGTALLTAFLLYSQFYATGVPTLAAIATAYLALGLFVIAQLVAFPGVILAVGLGPQISVWLFIIWHAAFPGIIAVWLIAKGASLGTVPRRHRGHVIKVATSVTAVTCLAITAFLFTPHNGLPNMLTNGGTAMLSLFHYGVMPVLLLISVTACALIAFYMRSSLMLLWTGVAVFALIVEILANIFSAPGRFSAVWYAVRLTNLFSDSVVLVTLIEKISALYSAVMDQAQALERKLELAHAVQQSLLPQEPPTIAGLDIAGKSVYCDETGGDYYDFVDLSDGTDRRLALIVGDVSGHGIGSALLMSSVRGVLRGSVDGGDTPIIAVERANRLLCADAKDGTFMTLILLVLDAGGSRLRWVNAAHEPPAIYHVDSDTFLSTELGDIAIGIDPDRTFSESQLTLPPGEFILAVGTDGIWETRNHEGLQFGRNRFRALLRESAGLSAQQLCEIVMSDVSGYNNGGPIDDDVTLTIAKFTANHRAL